MTNLVQLIVHSAGMVLKCLLLFIVATVNAEFLIPIDEFGTGLTKISEQENAEINEICGQQPGLNKINDGTIAKRGQFPWAVAIESNKNSRTCSGTIISHRHVLTAAHCVVRDDFLYHKICKKTSMASVSEETSKNLINGYISYGGNCNFPKNEKEINVTGSTCNEDDMTRVPIKAVAWEKRYRDRPELERCTNFDIAIIEVAEDFRWSELARPACLLLNDFNYTDFVATFSGFGGVLVDDEMQIFPDLRYGAGKIVKNDTMSIMNISPRKMTRRELRREGTSSNAQVEYGDSGGGIIMKCGSQSIVVGVSTDKQRFKVTAGGQVNPHVPEICELTGICPTEHCATAK